MCPGFARLNISAAKLRVPFTTKSCMYRRFKVAHAPAHIFFSSKLSQDTSIDISPEAQIANIEKSFQNVNTSFNLAKLKYPGKPHLKAVESWEIFPDDEIWANAYDLFKFSERPGDRPIEVRRIVIYLAL